MLENIHEISKKNLIEISILNETLIKLSKDIIEQRFSKNYCYEKTEKLIKEKYPNQEPKTFLSNKRNLINNFMEIDFNEKHEEYVDFFKFRATTLRILRKSSL